MKTRCCLPFIILFVLLVGLHGVSAQTRRKPNSSRIVRQKSPSTRYVLPRDEANVKLGNLWELATRLETRAKIGLEPNSPLHSTSFLKDSVVLSNYAKDVSGFFKETLKDTVIADSIRLMGEAYQDAGWLYLYARRSYARRDPLAVDDFLLNKAREEAALRETNQREIRDLRERNYREGRDNSDDTSLLLREGIKVFLRASAQISQEQKILQASEQLKEQTEYEDKLAKGLLRKYGLADKWSEQRFAVAREVFAIGISFRELLKKCQSPPRCW